MKLDEFLPQYGLTEIDKVKVKDSAQAAFCAMKGLLPSELSPLVFFMLNLREWVQINLDNSESYA